MGNVYYLKMNLQFFAEGNDGVDGNDGGENKEKSLGVTRNLSSTELQQALREVINIPESDRGALALELVNITNAVDRIVTERNTLREQNEIRENELQQANQRIGQLYSQVTQNESLGGKDPLSQIDTQKTLNDLGRK